VRRADIAVALTAAALLAGACHRADSDAAFGQRVRTYLLDHPEVLVQAEDRLREKASAQQAADQKRAQAMLPAMRAAIERDPADFVAHPLGRITVTEFYDYRCPHCENVAPLVLALIGARPDVRVVFKEMPIFGALSEHAARAAYAVGTAHGDYLGFYKAAMSARALDDVTIDRLALAHGAHAADLAGPAPDAVKAHLARTARLFTDLDLGGTPAFVVGDRIVYGEDVDGLRSALAEAANGVKSPA
jgi:protein-disulfide isomerase